MKCLVKKLDSCTVKEIVRANKWRYKSEHVKWVYSKRLKED